MTRRAAEFVATLGVPKDASLSMHEIAGRFEDALISVISMHPAVTEYFVQGFSEAHEVHIGLRFEDVDPDTIEDWARDLITETIDAFKQSGGLGRAANLRREDTGLVVA